MKLEIDKADIDKYFTITLNGSKLSERYNNKELIKAVIGIIRSCYNITDSDLKEYK